MPVTGTYNTNELVKGPVKIYLDAPLAADGAVVALTAGVPSTGLVAGLTVGGPKVTIGYTESSEDADEVTAPFNKIISAESILVEFEMFQLEDMPRMAKLAPTGTYFLNAAVSEGIKFGGLATIPAAAKPNVLIVGPLTSDPTKFMAIQLFSAINTSGISWEWTKRQSSRTPIRLEGQSIPSRTPNNQVAIWWKTLA